MSLNRREITKRSHGSWAGSLEIIPVPTKKSTVLGGGWTQGSQFGSDIYNSFNIAGHRPTPASKCYL